MRVYLIGPERPAGLTLRAVDGKQNPGPTFLLPPREALGELAAVGDGADAALSDDLAGYARVLYEMLDVTSLNFC
jgi:hypothetical protein